MSQSLTVRDADTEEVDRIRELVDSSMTTSYALSPQDIDAITDTEFDPDALASRIEDSDTLVSVAEVDDVVSGVIEARTDDETATIRWLHVDPERRGGGVGTELFEHAQSQFEDRGVDEVQAVALAANTTAGAFFERFGFEQVEERNVEIGGRESVEYVYAPEDSAGEESTAGGEAPDPPDTVTTDDGEEVTVGDETFEGTEGSFAVLFVDADREEQYGYYCLNCESTDVSMDSMERLRCGNCGNTHKPDDDYDGSYL